MAFSIGNIISIVGALIVVIIVILWADKKQAKKIEEVNNKIQQNPKYLDSKNNREMSQRMISMISHAGPYTIVQGRKLKKALSKYKK